MIGLLMDPIARREWKVAGYAWLAIFFARLAIWYWIEERYGPA